MTTTTVPGGIDVPAPTEGTREEETRPRARRRSIRAFVIVGIVLVAIAAFAFVWWLSTRGKESTDDATVQADVVPLSARVGGAVKAVPVRENQHVRAGDVVLEIDDADLAAKMRQSEADLAAARGALVRAQPQAQIDARELVRSERLRQQGAIPLQQLEQSQVTARGGRAALLQAQANLAASEAALDAARLQLSYTKVVAPGDGYVSSLMAHPGQILSADEPFAQFVPDHAYVVANFKETQIGDMHPGQRATLTIDAYGHRKLEGRVESLSAGTGAEFSLLPANNATGNFVKVVQRVPVRIALVNPPEDLPLRAGLSADVTVYVH
jgi:membrane fusion protein (multidrug efflux system)